jgi:predicted PurR-regulated permease PerM
MNKKLAAVLLVVAVLVLAPMMISAQTPAENMIMSGLTALSSQISVVEGNIMGKLNTLDERLARVEQALGGFEGNQTGQQISPLVSGVQSLSQMVQIAVGLGIVGVALCIINLFLLLRKPKAPEVVEPKEAKATERKAAQTTT